MSTDNNTTQNDLFFNPLENIKEEPKEPTIDSSKFTLETDVTTNVTFGYEEPEPKKEFDYYENIFEAVTEDLRADQQWYKPVLKNQIAYLKDARESGIPSASSVELQKLLLPTTRRVLDNLTITELVGVQPMQGPCSMIYSLEYKGEDTNNLHMEIVSNTVEARARKLQASFTMEAMQDMHGMSGMDFQCELVSALSQEIALEINNEWLATISEVAHEKHVSVDNDVNLLVQIHAAANEIAIRSKRGAGNWLVVDPTMFARIKMAADEMDEKAKTDNPDIKIKPTFVAKGTGLMQTSDMLHVGTLFGTMKVYCNVYSTTNELLVGYKGGSGETDTGIIFAPYVMALSGGILTDPRTFQPISRFMTRYGRYVSDNASNYYTKIIL